MKKILVSPLTGRIHYATVRQLSDNSFQRTGKSEDITEDAVAAVFEWFMYKIKNTENANGYTIRYQGVPYVLSMTAENAEQKEGKQ
jgi:hypothetical protein